MKASSLGPLLNLDKFVVAHANLPAAVAVATLTMFVVAGLNQPWLCGGGICVCVGGSPEMDYKDEKSDYVVVRGNPPIFIMRLKWTNMPLISKNRFHKPLQKNR